MLNVTPPSPPSPSIYPTLRICAPTHRWIEDDTLYGLEPLVSLFDVLRSQLVDFHLTLLVCAQSQHKRVVTATKQNKKIKLKIHINQLSLTSRSLGYFLLYGPKSFFLPF